MMKRLLRSNGGASAAEFALVLPLLMVLTLGTIDVGRYFWELNRAKKATQYGVRYATVVNPVEGAIASESFLGVVVGSTTLTQGDIIPAEAMGEIACTRDAGATASCSLVDGTALSGTSVPDNDTFSDILARMQAMYPAIQEENLVVTYQGSGLGYAGDPNGADIAPLVTVRLRDLPFTPVTGFLLVDMTLPPVASSLTAEDLSSHNPDWGTQSN